MAIDTAWLAWRFLPYERLSQTSPAERLFLWEAIVWLGALTAIFLGSASVIQVVGGRFQEGATEFLRSLEAKHEKHRWLLPAAVLPWWLIFYGMLLITIASLTRLIATT